MIVIGILKSCEKQIMGTLAHILSGLGVDFRLADDTQKCDIFITNDPDATLPPLSTNATVILLDTDIVEHNGALPFQVISCGLSGKSTVTATSIDTDIDIYRFNYCLRKDIVSISGKTISEQEIPVCLVLDADTDITTVLASFTVVMLTGKLAVINHKKSEYL